MINITIDLLLCILIHVSPHSFLTAVSHNANASSFISTLLI